MEHITIPAPTECWEITVFDETECWEMARNGIVTYDEADHMVDGMTRYQAQQVLAAYECPCDVCDAI